MKNTIAEIKSLIYAVLAHAPEKEDCTTEANEMLADMQRLRLSIEMFESKGAVIYSCNTPSENIQSDRAEYDTVEFAKIRTTEIITLLENDEVESHCIPVIIEEYNLLAQHLRNHGEEIDDIEEY